MLNYLKESYRRKVARRITKDYPHSIAHFDLEKDGVVEFANWDNPLARTISISQSDVDFYRKFITEGDLVIDIGSNIGDTTVPMAIAAGKEGTTIGFDPNPRVFEILRINSGLNTDKTRIIPVLSAISSKPEEFYYISSEASFANGGISTSKESVHGKYIYPEKVKGINLYDFLTENHKDMLDKLSFIKIDTEGHDKEIIRSITDLLNHYKPTLIAECFGKDPDEAKIELFHSVHSLGYRLFYFDEFKDNMTSQEIKSEEEITQWNTTFNFYAIHTEKLTKSI